MGRDAHADPDEQSTYECHECSHRVTGTSHPVECPECGESMRNCGTPLE